MYGKKCNNFFSPKALPPGSFPSTPRNQPPSGTITKPPFQTDEDDDENTDSIRNYNVPQQTRAKKQQKNTTRSGDTYSSNSSFSPNIMSPSNAQFRGSSAGFPLVSRTNKSPNNIRNSLSSINSSLGSRLGSRPRSQSNFPTIQSIPRASVINPIPTPANRPPQMFGGVPPGRNPNQSVTPLSNNPSSSLDGFPSGMNTNQSPTNRPTNPALAMFGGAPSGMNTNQPPGKPPTNPALAMFGGAPSGTNTNQLPANPPTNPALAMFGGAPSGMNTNQPPANPPTNPALAMFGGAPSGMNTNQPPANPPTNPALAMFGGASPGTNLNQAQTLPKQPSTNDIQSPMNKMLSVMQTNQTSPTSATSIPQIHQTGSPADMSSRPLPSTQVSGMNIQQGSSIKRTPSFRDQSYDDDNVSRIELDYPIENVLVDAGIPSTVAIKINELVEQDRLGKNYHIHRYTYEPPLQQISVGNNQHMNRRLMDDNYYGGTRYIREIQNDNQNVLFDNTYHPPRSNQHYARRRSYSETSLNRYIDQLMQKPGGIVIQAQNSQNLQEILGQYLYNNELMPTQSSINPPYLPFYPPPPSLPAPTPHLSLNTNPITEPFSYYTAYALPNDPMRCY
ncbi:unnamed protein product [Rotaria sp. Silwood1]|nr:unnamed protein product [Rotaria sp. Silwood1]CAF4601158.1 unnamed protein product [Rotaria sp. Silwood1]